MSKKLIISLLTLSLLPGTALSQRESSHSNQIIFQENSQENPAEVLNYLNVTKMCSDVSIDAAKFGTVIVGLSVANSVCANVSELNSNGYSCVQPISAWSSYSTNAALNRREASYYVALETLKCSKTSSGGIIELFSNFQLYKEVFDADISVIPNGKSHHVFKKELLDIVNLGENFLKSFSIEAKEKHLSSAITKIEINCNVLNSCAATNKELAEVLVYSLPSVLEMQISYGKISGVTEFGEKITIVGAPEYFNSGITIQRGNLDSYRPGGITLD